jgi:hypothetical protein
MMIIIRDQILSTNGLEINFPMGKQNASLSFVELHFADLKTILKLIK